MTLPVGTVNDVVVKIDAWLDGMRGEGGYAGPVAHRWQDCLIYAGPGFDWRYEGIISGYLRLFESTAEPRWLEKAIRAGNDLLQAQLPDGRFPASSFESNPTPGGTPHEAACDLALLRLAACLKKSGDTAWECFVSAAQRNLVNYQIGVLWDEERKAFCNLPGDHSLVPNKIATMVEAGFALAGLDEQDGFLNRYLIPALDVVLQAQVKQPGSRLDGAIDQALSSGRYFPYYGARCIPALLLAYDYKREQVYLDAAVNGMDFVMRTQYPDGSFPQVIYANGRQTDAPRWIAACGDILRAAGLLAGYGYTVPKLEQTEVWLLSGLLPSGGIRTASGFGDLESFGGHSRLPDFRDLLPVCGWVDKAFHDLAGRILPGEKLAQMASTQPVSIECTFQGRAAMYTEDENYIQVTRAGQTCYSWQKGTVWAALV